MPLTATELLKKLKYQQSALGGLCLLDNRGGQFAPLAAYIQQSQLLAPGAAYEDEVLLDSINEYLLDQDPNHKDT